FVQSFPVWIKHKLFLKQELLREFKKKDKNFDIKKILFSEHHLSHAASAFYPSPFEEALVVTCDGVGEWATLSVGIGKGASLKICEELFFPHSLGLLYSALTAYCGFKVNSGEYKVMGLAPYGEPRFYDVLIKNVVSLHDDGSFELQMKYFDFIAGQHMYSGKLVELLGVPPRLPESDLEPVHMDIAASLQKVLETILLHVLTSLQKKFPQQNLCLAGGVALNCVANSKIKFSHLFKNIWIQPAAGDAGGSLGAALAAYYLHFKNTERAKPIDDDRGMYLGPQFTEAEIEAVCKKRSTQYQVLSSQEVIEQTAVCLAQGQAVGWFQGAMEFGPRALGSRSILADARHPNMQQRLNLKIKFRESFRPFAPIVREEDVSEYFDWKESSHYMMFVAELKDKWRKHEPEKIKNSFGLERLNFARSEFPAITHLDYSARLQTVAQKLNPKLHSLLTAFQKKTGSGVLVNTSFNVRGEPIVCTPDDAIDCFLATDVDLLVLGNIIIKKTDKKEEPLKRHFELD
ncbi:MAG: hypothetical protein IT287_10080, partial [Bdellovibrionaceae bacterium]|nr:hypothetical protein [Pseudobdellovibrionaceae bacterium]